MNYFVTGGAGFIGSNMVDALLQDADNTVTIYDNFISGQMSYIEHHLEDKRFKLIKGDLLDLPKLKEAMAGSEFVFHFAANPDIAKAMVETDLDLRLGVIATYNVLEAMRINDVKQIAYSSGSGIYGDVGLTPTAEDFGPLLPSSMYGASKLGAEGHISAFCHMYEMQAWIFRFANVVGWRQTHGVGFDFVRRLKEDPTQLRVLGDGNQSKSYIHVTDVLAAMRFVIENTDEVVNIFNVATDDYITVNEIANITTEELGLTDVKLTHTGGTRGWKGDVPVVRFDLTKVHALGWKSSHNSAQAIRRSIKELLKECSECSA